MTFRISAENAATLPALQLSFSKINLPSRCLFQKACYISCRFGGCRRRIKRHLAIFENCDLDMSDFWHEAAQ